MLSSLGTGVVLALLFNVYWLLKQKEYDSNDDENYINNNPHSTLFQTLFIVSSSPPIGSSGQVPPLSPLTGRKSSQDTDKLHTWGGVEEEEGGRSAQASITRHHRLGGPKRQKLIL